MNTSITHARSLAALGHEARLDVFRLLVKAGQDGLTVGEIGQHLGLAPSTLAHHLRTLVDARLVVQERNGREVRNMVDYDVVRNTVEFLTSECCEGLVPARSDTAA